MAGLLIEWSDDLRTGIIWQDYQHKALIENIKFLYIAIREGHGKDHISEVLTFLET